MKNKIINTLIILFILVIIYYVYSIYFTIYESLDNSQVYDYLNSDIVRIEKKIDDKNKSVDGLLKQMISMKTVVKTNSDNIIELNKTISDYEKNINEKK